MGTAVAASTIYGCLCEDTELVHTDVEKKLMDGPNISACGSLTNKLIRTGKENFKRRKTRFLELHILVSLSEPIGNYMYH
jgi:hypothetical protein